MRAGEGDQRFKHADLDGGAMRRSGDVRERRHEALIDDRPAPRLVALEADEAVRPVDDGRGRAVDRVRTIGADGERLRGRAIAGLVDDEEARSGRIGGRTPAA